MTIRKTVTLVEEINSEYGAPASPPLRRVPIAAVFENPLAGKATGADPKPLIVIRSNSGLRSPRRHWRQLGASPAELRDYTKAAVVGIGGDLEHGAAMIHPQPSLPLLRNGSQIPPPTDRICQGRKFSRRAGADRSC